MFLSLGEFQSLCVVLVVMLENAFFSRYLVNRSVLLDVLLDASSLFVVVEWDV
jgi:hypothetical protein